MLLVFDKGKKAFYYARYATFFLLYLFIGKESTKTTKESTIAFNVLENVTQFHRKTTKKVHFGRKYLFSSVMVKSPQ